MTCITNMRQLCEDTGHWVDVYSCLVSLDNLVSDSPERLRFLNDRKATSSGRLNCQRSVVRKHRVNVINVDGYWTCRCHRETRIGHGLRVVVKQVDMCCVAIELDDIVHVE